MAPVTEIAILPLKAGSSFDDATTDAGKTWQELAQTIADQPGFQQLYYSRALEDQSTMYLFVDWEELESHKTFIESRDYPMFMKSFGSILSGPPKLFHAAFRPDTPAPYLNDSSAPIAEVLLLYFSADISESQKKEASDSISQFPFKRATLTGWSVDEVSTDKVEGGKASACVMLIPWISVEEHTEYKGTSAFKDNISKLIRAPGGKGLDMVHVKCTEIQGNGGPLRGAEGRGGVAQEEVLNPHKQL